MMKSSLAQIWYRVKEEYPQFSERSIKILLRFPTLYLCEAGLFLLYTLTTTTHQYEWRSRYEHPAFFYEARYYGDFKKCNTRPAFSLFVVESIVILHKVMFYTVTCYVFVTFK